MNRTWLAVGTLTVCACLAGTEAWAQRGIARGRVVDDDGQGLAEATVVFAFQGGFDREYQTRTDKKGKYTQIVTPGPYRITASKEGFQGAYLDHTIDGGAPTTVPDLRLASQEKAMAAAIEKDAVLGPLKRARDLTEAGRLEEAEAAYKEALASDPSVVEAHFNLGSLYLGREELALAEAEFQRVLELRPETTEAHLLLSRVYEEKGEPDRALEVMVKAVAAQPEDARLQFDLGILHYNARRTEEAERAFKRVEALDPRNARVQYLLATLALNRGDVEDAVARLETYLQSAPEDAPDRETARTLLEQVRPGTSSRP